MDGETFQPVPGHGLHSLRAFSRHTRLTFSPVKFSALMLRDLALEAIRGLQIDAQTVEFFHLLRYVSCDDGV